METRYDVIKNIIVKAIADIDEEKFDTKQDRIKFILSLMMKSYDAGYNRGAKQAIQIIDMHK
ncbi:hypothetical protein ACG98G_08345 [Megasphaera hexanoica]|uniref:Uncharacterized protein n=1 Tax=Megasphaera hexanoica TaxID=1675036 RepID=A0ABW7DP86_9FIRM|nr:hypothetical protein [Megasphaera hexanoica]AXB81510.1 hypothetical protein ACT01_04240 [Megasphaera hexanoica]